MFVCSAKAICEKTHLRAQTYGASEHQSSCEKQRRFFSLVVRWNKGRANVLERPTRREATICHSVGLGTFDRFEPSYVVTKGAKMSDPQHQNQQGGQGGQQQGGGGQKDDQQRQQPNQKPGQGGQQGGGGQQKPGQQQDR
jgi:hypothetical protein